MRERQRPVENKRALHPRSNRAKPGNRGGAGDVYVVSRSDSAKVYRCR